MSRYRKMLERPDYFRLNPNSPLAEGLVFAGLGRFPGGLRYDDATESLYGGGNHGTLTNMEPATDWVWVPELGRWALDFDGVDDYVPLNRLLFRVNADITFAVWINPRALSVQQSSVFLEGEARNYMYLTSTTVVVDQYPPGGGAFAVAVSGLVGKWTHLAYVRAGITESIYINGQATSRTGGEVYSGTTPTSSRLGAREPGGVRYVLNALLSDFVAAERAYSQDEIRTLADPSDPMLGGLILPPKRRLFPSVVGSTPTNTLAILSRRNRILSGGVGVS